MTKLEAAVIGAGPTGLLTAMALARVGVAVALVGPDAGGAPPDRRTTALVGPSIQLLRNLGVWEAEAGGLAPHAASLGAVRIADDRSGLVRAPEAVFRSAEMGLDSFGANIANPALLAGLRTAAGRARGLVRVETAAVTRVIRGAAGVRLELAEGGTVEACLAVAADGRNSLARRAAGISVSTWDYPQTALVTRFAHSRPHGGVVNELHRDAGPLTSVPLPGAASALVWVEAPEAAERLAALDDGAFAALLEERLQGVLGAVRDPAPRALHRLGGLRAHSMTAPRVALVGEAAHVVPPVGAQGLNLGLRDAAQLADCVAEARAGGRDIGSPEVLAAYARARAFDVLGRALSIDLLNRSLLSDLIPVDMARGLAQHLAIGFAPLRRFLMQEGMGLAGPLPSLMRRDGEW
jgi:2-octaprenyl-6-methoxyphenol hydroxylase